MILKIDTTDRQKIQVELTDAKSGKIDSIEKHNQVGSQVLLVAIEELLSKNGVLLSDLKEVQVNRGPGSYTGTRVGVAVANALSWGLGLKKVSELEMPIYEPDKYGQK
ncbi:hypothetical protein HY388_02535 [Candidatus Daviesbacteria bacterium]|nr:hypothetical protein [Candidatus Daviesbacteria bacterium]